jgi:hypothetical protein
MICAQLVPGAFVILTEPSLCPLLAQSRHIETPATLSAFGANRTLPSDRLPIAICGYTI